ncbi:GEVED domain-containing protein, partial [Thiolinea disciformis]|uniref:GEVED domain-containing protein n=1 Tax=Thiolinea disciformis TaxID=125614 RepID=UPI001B7F81CD
MSLSTPKTPHRLKPMLRHGVFCLFLLLNIVASAAWAVDYGDAPSSYGNASHATPSTTYYIGTTAPDNDNTAPTASFNGLNDDTTDTDDEGGITIPALKQGVLAEIIVPVRGSGGYLQAWIDWNRDGDFDDIVDGRPEQIATNFQDGAISASSSGPINGDIDKQVNNSITFQVLPPISATTLTTYARFRWSNTPNLGPSDVSGSAGEVEDHTLTIQPNTFPTYNTGSNRSCNVTQTREMISNGSFNTVSGAGWTNWTISSVTTGSQVWRNDQRTGYAVTYIDQGNTTLTQSNLTGWGFGPSTQGGALVTINLFWAEGITGPELLSLSKSAQLEVQVGGVTYATLTTSPNYISPYTGTITYANGATGNITSLTAPGLTNTYRLTGVPSTWIIELPSTVANTADLALKLIATPTSFSSPSSVAVDDLLLADVSALTCGSDYSDAPASYNSTPAPSHRVSSTLYLGTTPTDIETTSIPTPNADGDDLNNTDDEDGITLPSLIQGNNGTLSAKVTGAGGYLQGWIDWNGNGTFDTGEQVATNLQDNGTGDTNSTTGTIDFIVNVPVTATTNKTYARFRWSTTAGLNATDLGISNGEIEDYAVTVAPKMLSTGTCDNKFYGVGSNRTAVYEITSIGTTANSMAHALLNNTAVPATFALAKGLNNYLYTVPNTVINTVNQTTPIYRYDPSNPSVAAIDTGLRLPYPGKTGLWWLSGGTDPQGNIYFLLKDGSYLAKVDAATNVVSTVWSTWPTTGIKGAAGENFGQLTANVPSTYTIYYDLTFESNGNAIISDADGHYLWRVRNLSTTPIADYIGVISNISSISDPQWLISGGITRLYASDANTSSGTYFINSNTMAATNVGGSTYSYFDFASCNFATLPTQDFGDAPASYGSPAHIVTAGMYLGANAPDAETSSVSPLDGTGDNVTGVDDETAVTLPSLTQGQTASISVAVTGSGYLQAWIDWNGNGSFDAGEQIATDLQDNGTGDTNASSGIIAFTVRPPSTAVTTKTYARFRWSSTQNLNATTAASNGEVEDYALTIAAGVKLSGIVFEDVNYGGGAGRSQATAAGVGINGATIELYSSAGALVATTTTANDGTNNGAYTFSNLDLGNYYIRVVNDTVNSSRTGSNGTELAVQTFRTNGTTAVTNEVGGHNPAVADGVANTGTETLNTSTYKLSGGGNVQSLQPITVASTSITGIDFGFNFDTIVNTNDTGQGSLRQFILNSNLLGNTGLDQAANSVFDPQAGHETSIFMIPSSDPNMASGVATIAVSSDMPTITAADTHFNGYTQAGATPGPIGSRSLKVRITSSNSRYLFNLGSTANNTVIAGFNLDNFPNTAPISSINGASNLHIKGNYMGTLINGSAGTGVSGVIDVNNSANLTVGVKLDSGAAMNNDGMTDADEGNLIGKTITAISLWHQGGHVIAGNWIGVDATGLSALPNTQYGIYMGNVTSAQIGGTSPLQRNIISGSQVGLDITGRTNTTEHSTNVTVLGNYVGVGKDGVTAIPNTNAGILVFDADQVQIGDGTAAGANVVSGNTNSGIVLNGYDATNSPTTNVVIKGNLIGVAADGSTARGNGRAGIAIAGQSSSNEVSYNTIAHNTEDGVEIANTMPLYNGTGTPMNNSVSHNTLFKNGGLGIDLAGNGVTLNDASDSDTGANNLQNFPVFKSIYLVSGNLTLIGCAPTGSTIELFEADVSPTSSSGVVAGANTFGKTQDYGEGERYLTTLIEGIGEDSATVAITCSELVDADGNNATDMSPFQWTIPVPNNVVLGDKLTATATVSTLGTSEFSSVSVVENQTKDYSDAPASYGSPSHVVNSSLYLGDSAPDTDNFALHSSNADGDDQSNTDDEDSVTIPPMWAGAQTQLSVKVNGAGGYLQAWFDWNGNGNFNDVGEQVALNLQDATATSTSDLNPAAGTIDFVVTPPATATLNTTYARFRWSTTQNLTATTAANDGEVEDYAVTLQTLPTQACTNSAWYATVPSSGSAVNLHQMNFSGSVVSISPVPQPIGTPTTPLQYNNLAYRATDGYFYGIARQGNGTSSFNPTPTLVKIGSNGARAPIGWPVGLDNTINMPSATFGSDGYLYTNNATGTVYKIDVTTSPPSIVQQTTATTPVGGPQDIVLSADNKWAYGFYTVATGAQFARLDLTQASTAWESIGAVLPAENGKSALGAIFRDSTGAIYATHNGTGNIYRVIISGENTTTPFATFTLVASPSSIYALNNNDGAFCASQVFPITLPSDYSDAPSSYGTPNHAIATGMHLGAIAPDADAAAMPTASANGDNNAGSADEEGVSLPSAVLAGQTITITAQVTGNHAYLQAWIDWNGNGNFNDAGEQIITNLQDNGSGDTDNTLGTIKMSLSVPNGAPLSTYARFRWSSQANLTATGSAIDGEVEDYPITRVESDYADAPASYGSPSHIINHAIYLGSVVPDSETGPQPTPSANGDDVANSADEDGLASAPSLVSTATSFNLPVNVTNTTGQKAWLVGWIDLNGNGGFEPNEAATIAVSSGANQKTIALNWSGLTGLSVGTTYLRLRLTTDTSIATGSASTSQATGSATDGEVEDYALTITNGGYTVSGTVFHDTNVNAANDSEAGLKEVTVVLYNTLAHTCVATRTNADGQYRFNQVANGSYHLYEAGKTVISTSMACPPAANDPVGYTSSTPNQLALTVANANVAGQDFGDVQAPSFTLDNEKAILPNSTIAYPHGFRTPVAGAVAFSITTTQASPSDLIWGQQLLIDTNCDGMLNTGDTPYTTPLALNAGDKVCLLVKVTAPSNASAGALL